MKLTKTEKKLINLKLFSEFYQRAARVSEFTTPDRKTAYDRDRLQEIKALAKIKMAG